MSDKRRRWARVNDLLERALALPEAERLAWLESTCGDEPEVLAEVIALLAYDAEQTGGIRASVQSVAADVNAGEDTRYLGERIGNYRITEKIADGGMGSVYLGEHAADDFDQQVAIKLLPRHRLDAEATRRFVDERRILAGLQHPNIARLVDGGTLPDGVPYIVMDYIEGETIDRYCDTHDLDNAAIIDLVLDICDAVQYAHRKLVIHRDIKPGNILVGERGVPMLLDFGIAKLLPPDADDPNVTRAEHRVLTPMYASPEQIEGRPITTAADVYGLGLLLYRLLTGQMPYAPTGTTPRELERAILSQTPEKPSAAVLATPHDATTAASDKRTRRQHRALRGELDTILLTALRKSPERRYASVAALAEDLRRFREYRPILARRDSPLYVARKFVIRHRWPAGLAAAALAGAIGLTTYYTAKLKLERDTAEQTAAFLSDVFAANDPYQKNRDGLTVAGLLDAGLEKLNDDRSLAPLVRARLLTTIAQVQRNLGDNARAETLAGDALALAEAHAGARDAAVMPPLLVLSNARATAGDYPTARAFAERMLNVAEATRGRQSPEAAQATHLLSIQAYRDGDLEAMGVWAERTYAIRKAVYDHDDIAIAAGSNALGLYHWQMGDLEKARDFYAESARVQEAQAERNDLQYANLLHNLGLLHNDTGDYTAAVRTYEQSVAIRRVAAAQGDQYLPMTLYALAHSQNRLGDKPAAHRTFLETIPRQAEVAGPEKHLVGYALTGYGMLLEEMGALGDAERLLVEAERILDIVFEEPHIDHAPVWIGLARLATHAGNYERGRELANRAVTLRASELGADDFSTLRAHIAVARVEYAHSDYDAAETALRTALDGLSANGGAEHPFAVEAKFWLGRVLAARGDAPGAITLFREARRIGEAQLGYGHVDNVTLRLRLAEALVAAGERATGEPLLQRSREELEALEAGWSSALAADPVPKLDVLLASPEA